MWWPATEVSMRNTLADATFGVFMVGTGALTAWFGVTLRSPVMSAIGGVFALLGVIVTGLQLTGRGGDGGPVTTTDTEQGVSLAAAPECVREEVPPSSKLVWMFLAAEGPSTLDDIVDGTQLTRRTTRNAITRLEKYEVISRRPADEGGGRRHYDVRHRQEPNSNVSADESRSPPAS